MLTTPDGSWCNYIIVKLAIDYMFLVQLTDDGFTIFVFNQDLRNRPYVVMSLKNIKKFNGDSFGYIL